VYIIYLCTDKRLAYLYGRVACTNNARRLIHQSHVARGDTPPAYAGREHIRHVVFSTAKNSDILRRNIERVVYSSWRNLSARVAFEVFTGHPSTPRARGLVAADLPSMYTSAEALYPTARTFTFVNSDCISNSSFVATLDALLALETPFYATGRRTNVHWTYANPPVLTDFDGLYERGTLGRDISMDYFIASRGALQWRRDVPPVHPGYPDVDLWLLNYVLHRPDIVVVDVTRTVPMLHLLGAFGVNEGYKRPDYAAAMELAACEIALHRGQNGRYYYKGYTLSSVAAHSAYTADADGIEIVAPRPSKFK
jgi:hypothetical protein